MESKRVKSKGHLSTTTANNTTSNKSSKVTNKVTSPREIPPPADLRSRESSRPRRSTFETLTSRNIKTSTVKHDETTTISRPKSATSNSKLTNLLSSPPLSTSISRTNPPKNSAQVEPKNKPLKSARSLSARCSTSFHKNVINNKDDNNNIYTSRRPKFSTDSNLKNKAEFPQRFHASKSNTSASAHSIKSNNNINSSNDRSSNNSIKGFKMSKNLENSELGADLKRFLNHPLFSMMTRVAKSGSPSTASARTPRTSISSSTQSVGGKTPRREFEDEKTNNNNSSDGQDLTDERIQQEIEAMLQELQSGIKQEQEHHKQTTKSAKNSMSEITVDLSLMNLKKSDKNPAKKLKSESNLKKELHSTDQKRPSSATSSTNHSKMTVTKTPMTSLLSSSSRYSFRDRDNVEMPEKIRKLLNDNYDEESLRKKMALVKDRYKHTVKRELIDIVALGDDDFRDSPPNPDFVKMVMGLVEKDKEIANVAVGLVQEMDVLEKAELSYAAKKALIKNRGGNEEKKAAFEELLLNHKISRTQITQNLEKERDELFQDNSTPKKDQDEPDNFDKNNTNNQNIKTNTDNNNNNVSIKHNNTSRNDHRLLQLLKSTKDDQEEDEEEDVDVVEIKEVEKRRKSETLDLEQAVTKDLTQCQLVGFLEESVRQMKRQAEKTTIISPPSQSDQGSEERDNEIKRGLEKVLRRLGCDPAAVSNNINPSKPLSTNDTLLIIQEKMKSLKVSLKNLQESKKPPNVQN